MKVILFLQSSVEFESNFSLNILCKNKKMNYSCFPAINQFSFGFSSKTTIT